MDFFFFLSCFYWENNFPNIFVTNANKIDWNKKKMSIDWKSDGNRIFYSGQRKLFLLNFEFRKPPKALWIFCRQIHGRKLFISRIWLKTIFSNLIIYHCFRIENNTALFCAPKIDLVMTYVYLIYRCLYYLVEVCVYFYCNNGINLWFSVREIRYRVIYSFNAREYR